MFNPPHSKQVYILAYSRGTQDEYGKFITKRFVSSICNAICVARRETNEIYVLELAPIKSIKIMTTKSKNFAELMKGNPISSIKQSLLLIPISQYNELAEHFRHTDIESLACALSIGK